MFLCVLSKRTMRECETSERHDIKKLKMREKRKAGNRNLKEQRMTIL